MYCVFLPIDSLVEAHTADKMYNTADKGRKSIVCRPPKPSANIKKKEGIESPS
jgi:hypothetical protein